MAGKNLQRKKSMQVKNKEKGKKAPTARAPKAKVMSVKPKVKGPKPKTGYYKRPFAVQPMAEATDLPSAVVRMVDVTKLASLATALTQDLLTMSGNIPDSTGTVFADTYTQIYLLFVAATSNVVMPFTVLTKTLANYFYAIGGVKKTGVLANGQEGSVTFMMLGTNVPSPVDIDFMQPDLAPDGSGLCPIPAFAPSPTDGEQKANFNSVIATVLSAHPEHVWEIGMPVDDFAADMFAITVSDQVVGTATGFGHYLLYSQWPVKNLVIASSSIALATSGNIAACPFIVKIFVDTYCAAGVVSRLKWTLGKHDTVVRVAVDGLELAAGVLGTIKSIRDHTSLPTYAGPDASFINGPLDAGSLGVLLCNVFNIQMQDSARYVGNATMINGWGTPVAGTASKPRDVSTLQTGNQNFAFLVENLRRIWCESYNLTTDAVSGAPSKQIVIPAITIPQDFFESIATVARDLGLPDAYVSAQFAGWNAVTMSDPFGVKHSIIAPGSGPYFDWAKQWTQQLASVASMYTLLANVDTQKEEGMTLNFFYRMMMDVQASLSQIKIAEMSLGGAGQQKIKRMMAMKTVLQASSDRIQNGTKEKKKGGVWGTDTQPISIGTATSRWFNAEVNNYLTYVVPHLYVALQAGSNPASDITANASLLNVTRISNSNDMKSIYAERFLAASSGVKPPSQDKFASEFYFIIQRQRALGMGGALDIIGKVASTIKGVASPLVSALLSATDVARNIASIWG